MGDDKWKLIKTDQSIKSFINVILAIDDKIVVAGGDMCIRIFKLSNLERIEERSCEGRIFCGLFCDNYLYFGGDNGIYSFNKDFELVDLLTDQSPYRITALTSSETSIISGNIKGLVTVYAKDSYSILEKFSTFEALPVMSLAVYNDNLYVGGGKNQPLIQIWDLLSYTKTNNLDGHKNSILSLQIFNNEYLLSGDRNGIMKVYITIIYL